MTSREQGYVYYAECCESLERARRILQDLRGIEPRTAIQDAAFRYALVEYGKPYRSQENAKSYGRRAFKLGPPMLSLEDIMLHRQILALRDQVVALSELTLEDAMAAPDGDGMQATRATAQGGARPQPGVDAMIGLIDRSLDKMYLERAELLESVNASHARRRVTAKIVKIGIQGAGILAGLTGLCGFYLMAFTVYRSIVEGRGDVAVFAFSGLLFSAYLICFAYFASFRYSPMVVRHLCGLLAVCALSPVGKLINPSDRPFLAPFAYLAGLAAIYLAYRFASDRLNRLLFREQG